eukprot:Plantae.Rhodophyta-Rhodochaete_pulchella.ctg1366.p1 GENE.Plantae.Rhodophyta-Rhodochaete_pulchella.ctg1366~~Plantae.Rhodophyta-Rhodochaete_pulchella.ctg1366.p1  ORF type:complete len:447 (+),score=49.68 Plantae.Rhodophyta-Rhodochaete_pulchella.ctg1366:27-1343(+)
MYDGGGGFGGGGHGGRPARSQEVFDGKQLRKAIVRRIVDFNPSAMRWHLDRATEMDPVHDAAALQPVMESSLCLRPPVAPSFRANPITSATTKFVHSSVNKQRCPIHSCCWTPEGKRLITGASTGEFALWNGLTFNFETILQAHDTRVQTILWSRNGKWMLTGDQSGIVKYWQSNMNNLKAFQAHEQAIRDISFASSDLKFATCSDDGTIKIWDFASPAPGQQERVLEGHGWDVGCIDWHPQLPLIASGSKDSLIKVWDARSGAILTTLHGHKNTITKVKWNKNGNWLLTGSRDQMIKLYDIRTMRPFQTFKGHTRDVTAMKWHPVQEDFFVSASAGGSLYFWETLSSEPIAEIANAHQGTIWDLDWHPVGHILVTSSHDHATKFWTRNRPGDFVTEKGDEENPSNMRGMSRGGGAMGGRKRPSDERDDRPQKKFAGY